MKFFVFHGWNVHFFTRQTSNFSFFYASVWEKKSLFHRWNNFFFPCVERSEHFFPFMVEFVLSCVQLSEKMYWAVWCFFFTRFDTWKQKITPCHTWKTIWTSKKEHPKKSDNKNLSCPSGLPYNFVTKKIIDMNILQIEVRFLKCEWNILFYVICVIQCVFTYSVELRHCDNLTVLPILLVDYS